MNRDLRPHQVEALRLLRQSIASGHKRPVLMMPTGAGKTLTAAAIVEGARAKGNRVVFTVPALELVDQTVAAFGEEGIADIGVSQANHVMTDWRKPVQIASVQTLARRSEFPMTNIVVVDECHVTYRVVHKWMTERPDLIFVGLSATPWAKGMGRQWDDLLIPTSTQGLIDAGFLSPFRVFGPTEPDLSKVSIRAGDYAEDELSTVMSTPELVGDVVATWLKLGENRSTLCFAVDRAHARKLQDEFLAAGVRCAYVDAYTEKPERELIRTAFQMGEIKIIVNVGVLTTGVDLDVRCLILARPTRSEILFTQIVGRALRTAPGKSDALVLDHTGTTQHLGFVTDISHSTLDVGREARSCSSARERPTPLPKKCPACSFLKPAGVHVCPACGFAPQRQSDIEATAGDLVQLKGKARVPSRAEKQRFYSGLVWYAENRGYQRGWVANQFKKKFGVWPREMHFISAPPDATCSGWVTAQAIAYKKAMKKAERHAA